MVEFRRARDSDELVELILGAGLVVAAILLAGCSAIVPTPFGASASVTVRPFSLTYDSCEGADCPERQKEIRNADGS